MIEFAIIIAVTILILVPLILDKPDFFFWLNLMFFFDPGGFIRGYLGGNLIGSINVTDILFLLLVLPLFSNKVKIADIFKDHNFKIFFTLNIVYLIYYVLIYGLFLPLYYGNENFEFFLIKNRIFIMALPISLGVYIFIQRSPKLFLQMLIFFSLSILFLYFLTILTQIKLVPILTLERYKGSGITRIGMLSYGLGKWILPLGILLLLLKNKIASRINNPILVYVGAILMTITLFLTLTRRELIGIIFIIIVCIILISYIYKTSKIKLATKIIYPLVIILVTYTTLFPFSLNILSTIYSDTFSLLLTGVDTRNEIDYRVSGTGDLIYVKDIISDNLVFGTGYIPVQWSDIVYLKSQGDTFAMALDASAEVPIYGAFMRLGLLGVIIATMIYYLVIRKMLSSISFMKKYHGILQENNVIQYLLLLLVLTLLINKFTFNFYTLFYEFYEPNIFVLFIVIASMFYGINNFLLQNFEGELK